MSNRPVDESSHFQTVRVALGERSYPIYIGSCLDGRISDLLDAANLVSRHAVVIYDSQVSVIADRYSQALATAGCRVTRIGVPNGEASKSLVQAGQLWEKMLAEHTDRGSMVVAIGGGVVGDLAGFVAGTFARGLPLVQIPTTLLSHVDSSVGGKTGINLPSAKNMVGVFWQPRCVLIDITTLESLPHREYVSGLAEIIKYGVILLPDLFEYMEQHVEAIVRKSPEAVVHLVSQSCRAKASVVENDERETTGLRAILNYGHTFAHALESVLGYGKLLHGEAVAIGMHMAAKLAMRLGRVDQAFVERQRRLIHACNLPTTCNAADPLQLWSAMQHDKKVEHGKLRFILPTRLGHVELVPGVDQADAIAAMVDA